MAPSAPVSLTTSLPVMEQFYTIQGEGFYTGHASYFIRLGGCDVGCVWCDVKESWDVNAHPLISAKLLAEQASSFPASMAVITGGEPLMHNLTTLINELKNSGLRIHLETSGAYALNGQHFDWICVSPKKFKAPQKEVLASANELKVVVFNKSDFAWAEEHAAQTQASCKLYLQPEWSKRDEMMPLIVSYIKANPQWQVSLQTHKYLQIP